MEYEKFLAEAREKMEKTVNVFTEEIKKIQTGRVSTVLVEDILVDYYGSKAPIKQVAAISIPEPRQILISPWNKDDLVSIRKAVEESDLGASPQNDGEAVRIIFPPLTQERREELKKIVSKEKEKCRITIKQIREDASTGIKSLGSISEDDKFKAKEKLQEIVEEFNKKVDEITEKKEEEITNV